MWLNGSFFTFTFPVQQKPVSRSHQSAIVKLGFSNQPCQISYRSKVNGSNCLSHCWHVDLRERMRMSQLYCWLSLYTASLYSKENAIKYLCRTHHAMSNKPRILLLSMILWFSNCFFMWNDECNGQCEDTIWEPQLRSFHRLLGVQTSLLLQNNVWKSKHFW